MTEFGPSYLEKGDLENNQIETNPPDQNLATLRSYLNWYNQALGNPQKYLGQEKLSQKEQDEIIQLRDLYQQKIDDYIQRQIEEEQDRSGTITYPEDIKNIEPQEFAENKHVELLSEMVTPKELGEINPIGRIEPPLAVGIYLTDLSLPAPTGKITVKSLPLVKEPKTSSQKINISLPQLQKSVPCPFEAEVIEVSQPESAKYQEANVISQLEKPADSIKYQLALHTELPKVNSEELKPTEEEIKYWQSVFPLPKVLQRLCKESPEDIPSYIGSYVAQNFCYVTNPDFGEFLQYGAEDLPIIMQELKVGHCDYLAWYTAAVLRSQGIPAWIGGGKVTTSDKTQFNGSYGHAVAVYTKTDGALGTLDPSSFCSVETAYHPEILTKKELTGLDEELVNAENDEEKRTALREFKNETIETIRKKINEDPKLKQTIHRDRELALENLRSLLDSNPDEIKPKIDTTLFIRPQTLEAFPKDQSLETLSQMLDSMTFFAVPSREEFKRFTKIEREMLAEIVKRCRNHNICSQFHDHKVTQWNMEQPENFKTSVVTDDAFFNEYNIAESVIPEDIDRIWRTTPGAYGFNIDQMITLIPIEPKNITDEVFSQKFKTLWQKYKINLLFSEFSDLDINRGDFVLTGYHPNKKTTFQLDEHLPRDIVNLNLQIKSAFTGLENRESVLQVLNLEESELNNAARRYLLDYEEYLKKVSLLDLELFQHVYHLTSGDEIKLAQTLFPQQEWHLSQNKYGMPVPGPSAREYQPGDDARYIHWKATAKQPDSKLMTREFEPEPEGEAVEIYLDRNIILPQSLHDYMGALGAIKAVQARGENNNTTIHILQNPETSISINPNNNPDEIINNLKDQIAEKEISLPELNADSKGFFISTSRMKCAAVNYLYPGLQTICLADEQYWLFPEVREDFVKNGIK